MRPRDRNLRRDWDALSGGFPTLRVWAIERRIANSTFLIERDTGQPLTLQPASQDDIGYACTYADNLRFYIPSRAFALIRKIVPQTIPRLYNECCCTCTRDPPAQTHRRPLAWGTHTDILRVAPLGRPKSWRSASLLNLSTFSTLRFRNVGFRLGFHSISVKIVELVISKKKI